MRRFLSVLIVGMLLCATLPAWGQASSPKLYVCNQGEATVSVIDMASMAVETTVDLKERGFSENAKPHHVVAEPDGSHWYVSLIGANTILKMNRQNEIVARLDNFEVPGLLALDPSKDVLYAGRSMSAVNPPKSLGMIERSDMEIMERVGTFFPRPHPLAVTPNGEHAFIASLGTNQLMGIDTDTRETQLTRLEGTTQTPVQFAATADGSTLIAGGQKTGQLLVFDASEAPALSVTDTLAVGGQPWHPVIGRQSGLAYVPNKMSNSISVVDVDNASVQATIRGDGLAQPHGTVLSADGRHLFVSNNNREGTYEPRGDNPEAGTVTVIDTRTNEIVKVIEVGTYPTGVGTFGGAQPTGS
ncbi:YncE family protein [Salinibacter ruber]|uniref:YncE family protein n=1 Tax=Salinibacter ruber TaxID=146919 RepID=UPI002166D0DF|nr:YncE family protein [Salinibacter ruber]MCS4041314.1 YVTN family beta-propeller protein [Salinibacter ruber]